MKSITATFWASVELFGQQGIQLIISIILARLLEPSDFGIIAMTTIFMVGATAIIEGGFTGAIIHSKTVDEYDKNTILFFNVLTSILFFAIFWFSAPLIADFYNEPQLDIIMKVISFGLIINSFGLVNSSLLQKELMFKKRALISSIAVLISGIVGVLLALIGFGVWALIWQQILIYTIQSLLLWIILPWKPRFVFNLSSLKKMFSYGNKLMLSTVNRTIFENLYSVIIGKFYTATELGFYYRSKRFAILGSQIPTTVISRVSFPSLAKIHDNQSLLNVEYKKYLLLANFVIVPVLSFMIFDSQNFINVLIGNKWLASAPYLRILCISGFFFPLHVLTFTLINSQGNSKRTLQIEIIRSIVLIGALYLTYKISIIAILFGEAVSLFVLAIFEVNETKKYIDIKIIEYLRLLSKFYVSSLFMFPVVLLIPNSNSMFLLIIKFLICFVIYIFSYFTLDKEFRKYINVLYKSI